MKRLLLAATAAFLAATAHAAADAVIFRADRGQLRRG